MNIFKLSLIILLPSLSACNTEQHYNGTIISDVNVIDVQTGEIFRGKDVFISNDKIERIENHSSKKNNADHIINATDQYLMPGLWDMHTHMDYEWVPKLYIANGVMGLRNMHGGTRIDDVLENRKDHIYHGFEFLYSGPVVDGPGKNWPGNAIAGNPEEGRAIVRDQYNKGYDFLKVYNLLSHETYMAIADECNKLNFPFVGHVPVAITTEAAIEAGQKSIEHMIGLEHAIPAKSLKHLQELDLSNGLNLYYNILTQEFNPELFKNTLKITENSPTWFTPTLIHLYSDAYESESSFISETRDQYIPKEEMDFWHNPSSYEGYPEYLLEETPDTINFNEKYYKLVMNSIRPMLENGTRFLAGTDVSMPYVYPGYGVHDELRLFVEAGFTELQALQTATLNPAIYAERVNNLGTVEEGKIANLIILEKNPLENIDNTRTIVGQFRRGKYISKKEAKKLLESIKK